MYAWRSVQADICQVFSVGSLTQLLSFRRPVTHLYARATSCLLKASTQLANRANTYTLKLNSVNFSFYQIQQVIVAPDYTLERLSVLYGRFSFHFSTIYGTVVRVCDRCSGWQS